MSVNTSSEKAVRAQLVALLKGGNAHMALDEAVKDFPISELNTKFPNGTYTSWGLLEHIRRTQWDILDFIRNPNYKELDWPNDYWPEKNKKATEKDLKQTIALFNKDSKELERIVLDPKTDLYAKIPHGTGQNILREILLVGDHNAYHIGEFAIMRQVMDTWGKSHK
jgi:hypothetical protein